jgi:hypothetical protein
MTYLFFVWLFSWEYMYIVYRLFYICLLRQRIKGLRQCIYVLSFWHFVIFRRSITFFHSSVNVLSKWFIVIVYNSNCHLLLWSSCKSKRADARAYVNKSFCQLYFYTYIYIQTISAQWSSTSHVRFVCVRFFCLHRYLINTICCSMSYFSGI